MSGAPSRREPEWNCVYGEKLTEHRRKILPHEKFIRAEVTDAEGGMAYTNYIVLN